jgi:uncharacterized membrane protein YcaP (DUF421 family)
MDWPTGTEWLTGDWTRAGVIVASAVTAYALVVAVLRATGKRTLSQLNAFDLLVTVGLGTLLGSTVVSPDTSVVEGVVAIASLVALQFVVAWAGARSAAVRGVVKARPRIILRNGRFVEGAAREERFARAEVLAAIRQSGHAEVESVGAVVLETNGKLSVLSQAHGSALEGVIGAEIAPGSSRVAD